MGLNVENPYLGTFIQNNYIIDHSDTLSNITYSIYKQYLNVLVESGLRQVEAAGDLLLSGGEQGIDVLG